MQNSGKFTIYYDSWCASAMTIFTANDASYMHKEHPYDKCMLIRVYWLRYSRYFICETSANIHPNLKTDELDLPGILTAGTDSARCTDSWYWLCQGYWQLVLTLWGVLTAGIDSARGIDSWYWLCQGYWQLVLALSGVLTAGTDTASGTDSWYWFCQMY